VKQFSVVHLLFINQRLHITPKIKIERIKIGRSWWPSNWLISTNSARIGVMLKVCYLLAVMWVKLHHVVGTYRSRSEGSLFWKKVEIHLSCEVAFENVRSNKFIKNYAVPHFCWKLVLEITYNFIIWILWRPGMYVMCIIHFIIENKVKGHSFVWASFHLQN
jgi:hypothetical protein